MGRRSFRTDHRQFVWLIGSDPIPGLNIDYERAQGWPANLNQSEIALFYECMLQCAQKLLDTADIVRDAILRQQPS